MKHNSRPLSDALSVPILFVCGKGGVGKTTLSRAIAQKFSEKKEKTLWVTFEDPTREAGDLRKLSPYLTELNCNSELAFNEYIGMRVGVPGLAKIFLQSQLIRYFAKAAPGLRDLVLLGKVWFDAEIYDRVVVDMPSTGYGIAMFQSVRNFHKLFRGGPIHADAERMLTTFSDSGECAYLIVALPEEMPLTEGLELGEHFHDLFPDNPPAYIANRIFPKSDTDEAFEHNPKHIVSETIHEYIGNRTGLEELNLKLWKEEGIDFFRVPYSMPTSSNQEMSRQVLEALP